jgi:hypothetical protein
MVVVSEMCVEGRKLEGAVYSTALSLTNRIESDPVVLYKGRARKQRTLDGALRSCGRRARPRENDGNGRRDYRSP